MDAQRQSSLAWVCVWLASGKLGVCNVESSAAAAAAGYT